MIKSKNRKIGKEEEAQILKMQMKEILQQENQENKKVDIEIKREPLNQLISLRISLSQKRALLKKEQDTGQKLTDIIRVALVKKLKEEGYL